MTHQPVDVTVVADAQAIWGSERSMLNLAPHLLERDIRLTLAGPAGEFADAGVAAGMRHVPLVLPPRGGPRTSRIGGLLGDARGVPAGVRRIMRATRGADVVHSNNLLSHPDVAIAGRLTRRPTVLELHDIVDPGAPSAVLNAAALLATAVVSISSATSATIKGRARERLVSVPQGVDVERFTPGPADPAVRESLGGGRLLIGMVGRIDPEKGLHRLIQAAATVADARVVVVGAPGKDAGGYLQEMRTLGARLLGDRITFAGPTDDVANVLRSLDILVNASDAEPFGLSVLEAQACGLAVVAANTGGLPDFVDNGRTGLLVGIDDPAELAAALRRLHDRRLRTEIGDAAAAMVRAKFGVAVRADTLAALYRRCAGRSSVALVPELTA